MSKNSGFQKILLVFLGLFFILYFFRLGSTGLIDVDEPRYAEAAREMLESGNFIVPYFNYEVRFDKPVFFYYMTALAMKIFGQNEFSARLPSVLSSLFCLVFLFYFTKKFYGSIFALLSVLVLMSSLEFAALSRFSIPDMTLTSFISCSIFSFFLGYNNLLLSNRFVHLQIKSFSIWYLAGFIFLALAVLTKGPMAMLLVFIVLFPFFWWTRQLEYFLKNKSFWLGFLLFMFMVFPWFLLVHNATGGEFTKVFFGLHNFQRYTSVVSGHSGPVFYYFLVILLGFMPWSFFLVQSIYFVLKKGVKDILPWFCLWWIIVVLCFFSISKTKLLTYILPIFPACSILVALLFYEAIQQKKYRDLLSIGFGILFLFAVVISYICLFHIGTLLPSDVKGLRLDEEILFLLFVMLVGVSMAWASSNNSIKITFLITVSSFFLINSSLIMLFLPKIDKYSQYLLRSFSQSIPKNVELATFQIMKPSIVFYSARRVNKINNIDKLQEKLDSDSKFVFITKKKLLEGVELDNAYLLGDDTRYVVYGNFPKS